MRHLSWAPSTATVSQALASVIGRPLPTIPRKQLRYVLVVAVVLYAAYNLGQSASYQWLIAIYGLIFVGILLQKPVFALPALVLAMAFVPFSVGTGTGTRVNISTIGIAALTCLWLAHVALHREIRPRPSEANKPWLALILISALSVVAGAAQWNPWVIVKDNFFLVQMAQLSIFALSACAFWLTANLIQDRDELRRLVVIVLVLSLPLIVRFLVPASGFLTGRVLLDSVTTRIWIVALALGLVLFHNGLRSSVRVALVVLAGLLVLGARSYGADWASGWLPAVAAGGIVVLLAMWERNRLAVMVATIVIGSIATALLLGALAQADQWSMSTRLIAWRGLFQMMSGRWVLGLGLASYWHYWRGILGSITYLDPRTGYMHYSFDPQVNMHNNYMDLLGQMGIVGILVFGWLVWALFRQSHRVLVAEPHGFGKAYAAACIGALVGMLAAGALGDWFFPFVYNIGLLGFRDSALGWLLLGGIVLLDATRNTRATAADGAPAEPA